MPRPGLTGSRIRARRLDLGIKQAELARRLSISSSYLNLIEHNRRRIGGKLLVELARALETDPATLAEGAEAALIEGLRLAAATPEGAEAELSRIEQFAGTFPGWAGLIVAQGRRIAALERVVETLNDRLTHDPFLSASLHDVLSTVTAIRSTSGILRDDDGIDPEWRKRFHRNLYEDSRRLAESAQALVSYLDAGGSADRDVAAPQEELETWLAARGWHLPECERALPASFDRVVEAAEELSSASGRALARAHLERAHREAQAMPLAEVRRLVAEQGVDPAALAGRFGTDLVSAFRRLATLPEDDLPSSVGLVTCDGSGTLTFRKPLEGFPLPRFGAACPLWPLYQALSRPMQPIRAELEQVGRVPQRFTAFAIGQPSHPEGFGGPQVTEAAMLILPLDGPATGPVQPVGTSCRICMREPCPARREPSIVGTSA